MSVPSPLEFNARASGKESLKNLFGGQRAASLGGFVPPG
jgi:hypothetical protein